MNSLEIKNLNFSYNDKVILKDINLYLKKGEIVAILGGSGAGKTTLFHLIAGLIPNECDIFIKNDEELKLAYMQQNDLLFEHLNIQTNIALPLIINKMNKKEALQKAFDLLEDFQLSDLALKYPRNLSGGQKQRIAFLRTIILKASLYLLDEPFNALDFITKEKIYKWFKSIQKELQLSTLIITHDINEALELSDRIYILNNAKIIKEIITQQTSKEKILEELDLYQL